VGTVGHLSGTHHCLEDTGHVKTRRGYSGELDCLRCYIRAE